MQLRRVGQLICQVSIMLMNQLINCVKNVHICKSQFPPVNYNLIFSSNNKLWNNKMLSSPKNVLTPSERRLYFVNLLGFTNAWALIFSLLRCDGLTLIYITNINFQDQVVLSLQQVSI